MSSGPQILVREAAGELATAPHKDISNSNHRILQSPPLEVRVAHHRYSPDLEPVEAAAHNNKEMERFMTGGSSSVSPLLLLRLGEFNHKILSPIPFPLHLINNNPVW